MVCRGWCWVLFSLLLHTTMRERMALPPASASRSKPFSGDPCCRARRAIQQQCCVATVVEVWMGFMLLLLHIGLQLVNSIIIMLIINSHYTTTPLLIYISVDKIHRAFWWVLYFLQILENVFQVVELGEVRIFSAGDCGEAGRARQEGRATSRKPGGSAEPGHQHSGEGQGQGQDRALRGEPGRGAARLARQARGDKEAACGLGPGSRPTDRPGSASAVARVRPGASPGQTPERDVRHSGSWQPYPVLKVPYIVQSLNVPIRSKSCKVLAE